MTRCKYMEDIGLAAMTKRSACVESEVNVPPPSVDKALALKS